VKLVRLRTLMIYLFGRRVLMSCLLDVGHSVDHRRACGEEEEGRE
jgi:hypothetical protein